MTHTPHELAADFPGQEALIHELKMQDTLFQRLMEQYHDVNRAVHRAETNVEPTDDAHETALRRERMHLKDRIAARLNAAAASV